jgi:hypothetical protein
MRLVFVAVMAGLMMSRGRRGSIDWMRGRCAAVGRDGLRASQMQGRLAGNSGAETKTTAAMAASFFCHRAQGMALGMIAGPAARTASHSGGGNCDYTHIFILAVSAATSNPD